jgi:hypothetical protein
MAFGRPLGGASGDALKGLDMYSRLCVSTHVQLIHDMIVFFCDQIDFTITLEWYNHSQERLEEIVVYN